MCYHFKIKENVRLLFCVGYYNSKSVYIEFILVIKLQDYGTLIVYVCTIQLMEHLELELDASVSDVTYYTSCS